jgi:ABC-2 type transport system permease protein
MNAAPLIARKEAGEILLGTRGLAWLLAVAVVLSGFGLLLLGSQELSLLDDAQVVDDMAGIVTALGALLAIVVGVDAIAGERERGSLVPLLVAPVSRSGILAGKLAAAAAAWAATYALAIPYLWAVGSTGQNLAAGLLCLALLGTPVVLGFGFFGLGIGARLASVRGALLAGLITLLLAASPVLIGPSLRQSAIGRAFDTVNPFSAAVNSYDAVLIDSQSITAQWLHFAVAVVWAFAMAAYARAAFRTAAR